MNEYFKCNPYKRWFQWHEAALVHLNASYGGKMNPQNIHYDNTAIHIDVETAIPTSPTWGKLCDTCKNMIGKQSVVASSAPPFSQFASLIGILNPDVIIVALGKDYIPKIINSLSTAAVKTHPISGQGHQHIVNGKVISYIRPMALSNGIKLIWVTNYRGTPFGGMPSNQMVPTMQRIANYI